MTRELVLIKFKVGPMPSFIIKFIILYSELKMNHKLK